MEKFLSHIHFIIRKKMKINKVNNEILQIVFASYREPEMKENYYLFISAEII